MSTPIKDGGPAFPNFKTNADTGFVEICPQGGMTLRDYFAGQALAGQLAFSPSDPFKKYHEPEDVARVCYRCADAMLKAREAKS